jgi:hypothetical protein
MGGLAKDLAVELADGTMAVVVEVTPKAVKLDATDTDTHTRTHTLSHSVTLSACSMGGLAKDLAVELANGTMAVVVEVTPEAVKLDANNMMSGKKLIFELEVLGIERP